MIGVGDQQFARRQSAQQRRQFIRASHRQTEFTGRQIDRRHTLFSAGARNGAQKVVARPIQQIVGEDCARCDRLDHFAPDDALGQLGVLHLFADGDAETLLHKASNVFSSCAHRHAGQRHVGSAGAVVARGEREAECARTDLRIFVEHFVEVTHPEQQDGVLMPTLYVAVLLHQGRARASHGGGPSVTTIAAVPGLRHNAADASASARVLKRPARTLNGATTPSTRAVIPRPRRMPA